MIHIKYEIIQFDEDFLVLKTENRKKEFLCCNLDERLTWRKTGNSKNTSHFHNLKQAKKALRLKIEKEDLDK